MPLLGRHKSPSSSSQVSPTNAPATGGSSAIQSPGNRQQVCESPLFGIRRQLNRETETAGVSMEPQAKRELGSVPQQITREQIHYAFSIMDTNKDGLIDLRDLSQMLSNLGVPIDEAILSHIMSSVSKRGDHRISESEFVDWIAHFIQITESTSKAASGRLDKQTTAKCARTNKVAASRSGSKGASNTKTASSLLAQAGQEPLQAQQLRNRRGSGSGLALMRSLSSSCAAASGTQAAFAPTSSPVASSSSPALSSMHTTGTGTGGRPLKREPSADSEARDDLKAAFCVFDIDGDGYITQDEVRAGLKLLGETWSQAELKRLFSKCSNSHQPNTDLSQSGSAQHHHQQQQQQQQQQRISIDDFVHLLL